MAPLAVAARAALTLCSSILLICPPLSAEAQTTEADQGQRLYESQCGNCHGPLGNGGKGANLARPQLRRASDDQALMSIIRRGIPGTEMPGSALGPRQVSSIAAYVKSLGRVEQVEVPGDASRGEATYVTSACDRCHAVSGRAASSAPISATSGHAAAPPTCAKRSSNPRPPCLRGFSRSES